MKIYEIKEMINNNIIPSVLDFTINERSLDWSKVSYNDHYKSFNYFANKLPNGWQSIHGFDLIIKEMADSAVSPLDEMNRLIAVSKIEQDRLDEIEKYNNDSYQRNSIGSDWYSSETFDFLFKK